MAFVRSSKFRHVFGTAFKKDKWYDNIKVTESPHESNMSSVNSKFIAVVTKVQGGGAFLVLPLEKVGRIDNNYPKVTGHRSQVLDVAWNPFNDNVIASASEDCNVMIWDIPDGGLEKNMLPEDALLTLEGHQRKVCHIQWHPSAENILASAAADGVMNIWNLETGELFREITVSSDLIQSLCWNYDGSRIAISSKDKKIRIVDPLTGELLTEADGHAGNKPSRVVYCGKLKKLFSTGFSRSSDRQYALWDPDKMDKPLAMENIDNGSGVLFPFWDDGTNMVYLVGKGDTQIRYFEVQDSGKVFFLSMYQGKDPGRSVCAMPKRHMDYMKCEVMRFFKLQKGGVEPISMTVPRKSDMFQADIFPACQSGEPALSADEWCGGKTADPLLIEFEKGSSTSAPKTKKMPTKRPAAGKPTVSSTKRDDVSTYTASAGEPTTLEEYCKAYAELAENNLDLYRKAYKELEKENRMLREKLGM